MERVYLDTSCLNRPFDDRFQRRFRLEAEAVERIIDEADNGLIHIVCSDALIAEADQAKNVQRVELALWDGSENYDVPALAAVCGIAPAPPLTIQTLIPTTSPR